MSYTVRGQVEGLGEALRALDSLANAARNRIVRQAVTAGARVIARKAKALAPRELGLLKKSIGQKVKVYRNTGTAAAVIGPRHGFRKPAVRKKGKWRPAAVHPGGEADPAFYAHLVELGTAPHRVGGRRHPGASAKPFLAPAATGQAGVIRAAMVDAIARGLAKWLASVRAKGG